MPDLIDQVKVNVHQMPSQTTTDTYDSSGGNNASSLDYHSPKANTYTSMHAEGDGKKSEFIKYFFEKMKNKANVGEEYKNSPTKKNLNKLQKLKNYLAEKKKSEGMFLSSDTESDDSFTGLGKP